MMFGPMDGFPLYIEPPKLLKAGKQHARANKHNGFRQTSGRPNCTGCGATLSKSGKCRSRKCNPTEVTD